MSGGRNRKAICAASIVALFVGAGAATAVVKDQVFSVGQGQVANLAGTRVYCKNGLDDVAKVRAFLCSTSGPSGAPLQGSYAIMIDEKGVEVDRIVSAKGDARLIRWFRSLPVQAASGNAVFNVNAGEVAQLAGTALFCGNQLTKDVRTFGCAVSDPGTGTARPKMYGALINERGVTVFRTDPDGKTVIRAGQWTNP